MAEAEPHYVLRVPAWKYRVRPCFSGAWQVDKINGYGRLESEIVPSEAEALEFVRANVERDFEWSRKTRYYDAAGEAVDGSEIVEVEERG